MISPTIQTIRIVYTNCHACTLIQSYTESRYNKEHTGGRFGHDHDRNQGAVRLGEEIKVENYNDHEGGIHERKHEEKHIEAHGIWGGPYTMHM